MTYQYWLLFLFLLIMSSIPIILFAEYFIRPIRIKILARRFGLSYKLQYGFIITDGRRNIITGYIGKNKIELYDSAYPKGSYKPVVSDRQTRLLINNKAYRLKGTISGYFPVSKINRIFTHIRSCKQIYPFPSQSDLLSNNVEKYLTSYELAHRDKYSIKISHLLTTLIVIVILIGLKFEPSTWKTYHNTTYQVSFKYPRTLAIDSESNQVKLTFQNQPGDTFVTLRILKNNDPSIATAKEWFDRRKHENPPTCCMDVSTLAGNDVVSYGFLDSDDDEYVLINNSFVYLFHFFHKPQTVKSEDYWELREQFFKSVQFN